MPYLIDTDWMIDRLDGLPGAIELIDGLVDEGIAISVITYLELYEGVFRTEDPDANELKLTSALSPIPVLLVSRDVARRCAAIRSGLRSAGKRVNRRGLDLLIAATALAHDLTLVTRNVADYSDIPGLRLHSGS